MNFAEDQSLTVFSSEGNLKQCDNALQAALNGVLSVGMRSEDGVVIASLKTLPPLIERNRVYKVLNVCDSIGMTYSGLQSDFRIIHNKAVKFVYDYKDVYGRFPNIKFFVTNFSRVIQEYTQKNNMRPFGNLIIFAGIQNDDVFMFQVDPYGSFEQVDVAVIGKFHLEAKGYLEKRMEGIDDNIVSVVNSLKEYAGVELKPDDLDIGVLYKKNRNFVVLNSQERSEIFESITK